MSDVKPEKKPRFPGRPSTADGSEGVIWVEANITQGACAYPITSSTSMGVNYAQAAADGRQNLWGDALVFLEAESEHSSASAAEGFCLAGGRVTNFTSGQGLVLMKEVLHVISGKRLPIVFHIGARALTSQALNVHAGHDDVMGVGDTGWGIAFARNAQEATDLALITRRVAEDSETPFLNVQDGFLTTHTIESVVLPEEELMREFVGAPEERVRPILDPSRGIMSGVVQNQDAYMRGKIGQRYYYDRLSGVMADVMAEYGELTGRHYTPVMTYKMEDAEYAIVALGTIAETAEAVADYMRSVRGIKVGVVHPTVFRPFPGPQIVDALKNVHSMAVIERMDNPPGQSNPLTVEIKASFADAITETKGYPHIHRIPNILSGTGGLGGRDVRPCDLIAVVEAMREDQREYFTLNLDHPAALHPAESPDVRPKGAFSLRGYSIGGFGSVTTNKIIATVSADLFNTKVQAYPKYGSEKKGLPTNYYLTLAPEKIRTHCEMEEAEFIPLNTVSALSMGNPLEGLTQGGTVFVQWHTEDPAEVWAQFPLASKLSVRRAKARVVYLDAAKIALEEASKPELSIRMQGIVLLGVFLKFAPFSKEMGLDDEALFKRVREALGYQFGKVSEKVVDENLKCVRRGFTEAREVPWDLIESSAVDAEEKLVGKTVADVMHDGVITCGATDSLQSVVDTMAQKRISAVVVMGEEGGMEGILSTTDLTRAAAAQPDLTQEQGLYPHHLMTRDVLVTWPGESLQEAVDRMLSKHVHRLVVVRSETDHSEPIGILSMTDLARSVTVGASVGE